jgi:hypothetical protein
MHPAGNGAGPSAQVVPRWGEEESSEILGSRHCLRPRGRGARAVWRNARPPGVKRGAVSAVAHDDGTSVARGLSRNSDIERPAQGRANPLAQQIPVDPQGIVGDDQPDGTMPEARPRVSESCAGERGLSMSRSTPISSGRSRSHHPRIDAARDRVPDRRGGFPPWPRSRILTVRGCQEVSHAGFWSDPTEAWTSPG